MLDAVERILTLGASHVGRRIQTVARIFVLPCIFDVGEIGDQQNVARTGLIEHREVRFDEAARAWFHGGQPFLFLGLHNLRSKLFPQMSLHPFLPSNRDLAQQVQ